MHSASAGYSPVLYVATHARHTSSITARSSPAARGSTSTPWRATSSGGATRTSVSKRARSQVTPRGYHRARRRGAFDIAVISLWHNADTGLVPGLAEPLVALHDPHGDVGRPVESLEVLGRGRGEVGEQR